MCASRAPSTRLRLDLNSSPTARASVPSPTQQQVAQRRDSDYSLMQTALSACTASLIGELPETFARKAKGKTAREWNASREWRHSSQSGKSVAQSIHSLRSWRPSTSPLSACQAVVRASGSWYGMIRWTEHSRMMLGYWSQYSREIDPIAALVLLASRPWVVYPGGCASPRRKPCGEPYQSILVQCSIAPLVAPSRSRRGVHFRPYRTYSRRIVRLCTPPSLRFSRPLEEKLTTFFSRGRSRCRLDPAGLRSFHSFTCTGVHSICSLAVRRARGRGHKLRIFTGEAPLAPGFPPPNVWSACP